MARFPYSRALIVGGLAVGAVVLGLLLHFRSTSSQSRQVSSASRPARLAPGAGALSRQQSETNALLSEEVLRLRAEVLRRDEALAALRAHAQAPAAGPDQGEDTASADSLQEEALAPGDRAIEILDERMDAAPNDPAKASEMEHALRAVIGSSTELKGKIASLHCGSTLCKVTLSTADGGNTNQSMAELGSNAPKLFGATAVHQSSDGKSAMYLARSRDDLAIAN